jgi:branched-chain amino acid transport system permease protein
MLAYLSVELVVQLVINGILFGAMYGIAAIGMSLIFGTMRILFLAQGTVIIFFAYICFWLFTLFGIDPYLSLIIVVPISLILGLVFYQLLFREAAALEDKNVSLLIAVGLMFLVENLMTVFWTGNPRSLNTVYATHVFHPFPWDIGFPMTRSIGLILAVLSTIGVVVFLRKTYIGLAVRAASQNMVWTTLMGVNPHWVNGVAFAIGIGLAGVAGVGLGTVYPFDPFYGFLFALKAVIALAIGGIGSVTGALLGGLLLGLIESLAAFFLSGGWADAISFAVFLLVLMFKPEGLFARTTKKA